MLSELHVVRKTRNSPAEDFQHGVSMASLITNRGTGVRVLSGLRGRVLNDRLRPDYQGAGGDPELLASHHRCLLIFIYIFIPATYHRAAAHASHRRHDAQSVSMPADNTANKFRASRSFL